MEEGLISRGGRNLRLPLRFELRPQGPCRVGTGESGLVSSEEGNPAGLSSCSGGLRPLVELCVEPACVFGQCTGVSVPLRVVPSPTGLPSKRCPGIGFLSRVDLDIGVVQHVAPPTWLFSNFLVRPASSRGAPGRSRAPSRQSSVIDPPVLSGGHKWLRTSSAWNLGVPLE